MLDFNDVLALNVHCGGRDAHRALVCPEGATPDLYEKLFSPAAVQALNVLLFEFSPLVVLTTSWLMMLDKVQFLELFARTGVRITEADLHPVWDAPQYRGESRAQAVARWMSQHHCGEGLLILDDHCSGDSLADTPWARSGHVVLCDEGVGFHLGLLDAARRALSCEFTVSKCCSPPLKSN